RSLLQAIKLDAGQRERLEELHQVLRAPVILAERDAAGPDDADLEAPAPLGEHGRQFPDALARRREKRISWDRRQIGREQARQAADVAMQVCDRQRTIACD